MAEVLRILPVRNKHSWNEHRQRVVSRWGGLFERERKSECSDQFANIGRTEASVRWILQRGKGMPSQIHSTLTAVRRTAHILRLCSLAASLAMTSLSVHAAWPPRLEPREFIAALERAASLNPGSLSGRCDFERYAGNAACHVDDWATIFLRVDGRVVSSFNISVYGIGRSVSPFESLVAGALKLTQPLTAEQFYRLAERSRQYVELKPDAWLRWTTNGVRYEMRHSPKTPTGTWQFEIDLARARLTPPANRASGS